MPSTQELVPQSKPRVTEPASTQEHRKLLAAFGGEYRFAPAQNLIDETLGRLSPATNMPELHYQVTILNSASINAFALPNGSIYVTRGLLSLANNTSELASVLAHEMAHVTLRHAIERAELERRTTLVSRVNADLLNDPQTGQGQHNKEARQNQCRVAIASFSRKQELEADQIGVRIMAKAGYDPYAATRFLKSLERSSVLREGNTRQSNPDFLLTHPSTPERVDAALMAAKQLSTVSNISHEQLQKDQNRYVNILNGMMFGDDPNDGVIIGAKFIHPRLGFAFNAPIGFSLKNSAVAVLGFKNNDPQGITQQGLRFETVRIAPTISLADYLKKSPVEGATTSRFETLNVEGFEAATAIANTDDWTYRFAVYRNHERSYRMIVAAQHFTREIDKEFLEALFSFHKLRPNEATDIHTLKIMTIVAQAGDTAISLAERMNNPDMSGEQKLEHFLVLNGLMSDEPLKFGTRYKIIG